MTVVRGERVLLRPIRADELDLVWSARTGDARGRPPAGEGDSRGRLRSRIASSGSMTAHELLFGIEAEDRLVGEIEGRGSNDALPPGVVELGVEIFDPARRGGRLGSDALATVTEHLFRRAEAHRVQASTDVENAAMRGALRRSGFHEEGVLRGFMPDARGPRDYVMYAMTRDDGKEARASWTPTS